MTVRSVIPTLLAGIVACAALVSACEGADCAGVGRAAFEITVLDARSSASLTDSVVVYVFQLPELVRVDSATRQIEPGRYPAAFDHSGRFNVIVERPGYFPWTTENRQVIEKCSVETVFLTARLLPRSS